MDNFVMKPMEAPEPIESSEQIDMQKLNDTTFEPSSVVEQTGDYRQSEGIQTGLQAVLDNAINIAIEPINLVNEVACDGSSKEPAYTERGSAIPEPVSQPGESVYGIETGSTSETTVQFHDGSGGAIPAGGTGVTGDYKSEEGGIETPVEGVAAMPEPIPEPVGPISAMPEPIPSPAEGVAAMPEPIPSPVEGVSAMPEPIPQPAEGVSAMPEPIPEPVGPISAMPEPIPHSAERVSAMPEPIPSPVEQVATMPEPIPEPVGPISAMPEPIPHSAEGVSAMPEPMPGPGGDISSSPVPQPLPEPSGEIASSPVPQPVPMPGGEISSSPVPQPLPEPSGEIAGSPVPQPVPMPGGFVSAMPEPIPQPSDIPGPLPGPAGDVSALPIPLPRPERRDESLQVSIPEGDLNALNQEPGEGPLKGSSGGDEGENIIPINLPHIGEVADTKTFSSATEGSFEKAMSEDIFTPIPRIEEEAYKESPSQGKEPFGRGDIPLPGIAAETLERGTNVLDTTGMADRMVQNTLSGLENLEDYGSTYQTQEAMTGMTALRDVAAFTLLGGLEIPGNIPTPSYGLGGTPTPTGNEVMEGFQIPLQPGTEVEEASPVAIEVTEPFTPTVESTSETGEEWTPPEMYLYYGQDGKVVVVDANGKALDSPPTVTSADGVQFFAYYPGLIDKDGNTIKFDISTYKGSLENICYYTDSQGKMIAVDANGKALDSPPIVTSPTGAPPYYAYYPGMVDENGNTIKMEVQSYKGSLDSIFYYADSQGEMIAVDANGKALDSPPIVSSPTGAPPYYAYYPGMVDENGNTIKVEVQSYKGSLENIYYYTDSQGKMIAVDAYGKALESPPIVTSQTGTPPYYAYYPGMVDENGNTIKVEVQSYKGSLENIYYYTDSQGKITAVDAYGKALDSPPIVTSQTGAPPYYAYYPGMVDENGNTIKVEVQSYKGSLENIYYYTDSQGKMIAVDANGKALDSPPIVSSPTGAPPYYAYYPGMVDENGNTVKEEIQAYHPPSASKPVQPV